mgnify:CR=1 FL=1
MMPGKLGARKSCECLSWDFYFCCRKRRKDKESGVARGIDFHFVSNIINFDFPPDVNSYIHRVGRTARGTNQVVNCIHIVISFLSFEIIFKNLWLDIFWEAKSEWRAGFNSWLDQFPASRVFLSTVRWMLGNLDQNTIWSS